MDAICVLLLSCGFAYATFWYGGVVLPERTVAQIGVAMAALLYSVAPHRDERPRPLPLWVAMPVLLFPVYLSLVLVPLPLSVLATISPARAEIASWLGSGPAPLSLAPNSSLSQLFRFLALVLIFVLARGLTWRMRFVGLAPLIAVAGLEAILGLAQAGNGVVRGTFINRNHFAGLLEMAIPFAIMWGISLLRERDDAANSIAAAALFASAALMLAAVIYSLSRGGFTGAMLSLFLLAILSFGKRLRMAGLGAVAVGFVLLFALLPVDELVLRFADLRTAGENNGARDEIWRDSIPLLKDYLAFGTGLGGFETAYRKYQRTAVAFHVDFAHNDFLQFLIELGLVGSALLAVPAIWLLTVLARNMDSPFAKAGIASLGAILFHSFADFNLQIPSNAMAFAWVCGACSSLPLSRGRRLPEWMERAFPIALAAPLLAHSVYAVVSPVGLGSEPADDLALRCKYGACEDVELAALANSASSRNEKADTEILRRVLVEVPANPDRWADYAEALRANTRIEEADRAIRHAVELGPNSPQILVRAGSYWLTGERPKKAIPLLKRLLTVAPEYAPAAVYSLWYRFGVGGDTMVNQILPESRSVAESHMSYLASTNNVGEAKRAWIWMSSHGLVTDRATASYADLLLANRMHQSAADAWALHYRTVDPDYLRPNRIFDSGFEAGPIHGPFVWRLDQITGASMHRDERVRHGGVASLRIDFAGSENLDFRHVSQTSVVGAGNHQFAAWVQWENLTTNQGIFFHLYDPDHSGRLDLSTEPVTGSGKWTRIQRVVPISTGTARVRIEIRRLPSEKIENKIGGRLWLDDVRLEPMATPYTSSDGR